VSSTLHVDPGTARNVLATSALRAENSGSVRPINDGI